ncbi:hypothetical protein [Pilimelia columellifera]|uniref:Uncharacterized protein n=1 Tax=Pilimelia columellifera subsp. columellifera TaxID=706583 RepID=A0ABN3NGE5_9ACTN
MPMTRDELRVFAGEQVAAADELLSQHRPGTHRCCSCGQPIPCSHAETIIRRRAHYAQFLQPGDGAPGPSRYRAGQDHTGWDPTEGDRA